jgi:hypothetical protein
MVNPDTLSHNNPDSKNTKENIKNDTSKELKELKKNIIPKPIQKKPEYFKNNTEKSKETNWKQEIILNQEAKDMLTIIENAKKINRLEVIKLEQLKLLASSAIIKINWKNVWIRKLFINLEQNPNDNMSINYSLESIKGTIKSWSDIARLLQIYIVSQWFSVLNENSTFLQSIDGKFNDSTIQWRDDLKRKIEEQDMFLKWCFQDLDTKITNTGDYNNNLQNVRKLSIETINYPIIEINSYWKTCYLDINKRKIYVLSDDNQKMFLNYQFSLGINKNNWEILPSNDNRNKLINIFWLMNIINRSRYISRTTKDKAWGKESYNPFYIETAPSIWSNERYIRYDDNQRTEKDKPLIKRISLWEYIGTQNERPIKNIVQYINKIHEKDYRPLPQSPENTDEEVNNRNY